MILIKDDDLTIEGTGLDLLTDLGAIIYYLMERNIISVKEIAYLTALAVEMLEDDEQE